MAIKAKQDLQGNRWTINRLWNEYRNTHSGPKGLRTYRSAFKLHVAPAFGNKEPRDILPLDIKRLSNQLLKTKSPQAVQPVFKDQLMHSLRGRSFCMSYESNNRMR